MKNYFITACLAYLAASTEVFDLPTDLVLQNNDQNGWASVTVNIDGSDKTLYMAMDSYKSSGNTITIPYGGRGYLSWTPSLDPTKFFRPNLLGGSVEFDADLSTRNCGCIAALYLVSMPGKNSSGQYWNTDGYYYCDAN